jgi:hypothetical protein
MLGGGQARGPGWDVDLDEPPHTALDQHRGRLARVVDLAAIARSALDRGLRSAPRGMDRGWTNLVWRPRTKTGGQLPSETIELPLAYA